MKAAFYFLPFIAVISVAGISVAGISASADFSADYSYLCKLTSDYDREIRFDLNANELSLHDQFSVLSLEPYEVKRGNAILENQGLKGGTGKMKDRLVFKVNHEKSEVVSETTGTLYIEPSLIEGGKKLENGSFGGYASFLGHAYGYETYICFRQDATNPNQNQSTTPTYDSLRSYLIAQDARTGNTDFEAYYEAMNNIVLQFDGICGDTFCEGDYHDLVLRKDDCSVDVTSGKLKQCTFLLHGLSLDPNPSNGSFQIQEKTRANA